MHRKTHAGSPEVRTPQFVSLITNTKRNVNHLRTLSRDVQPCKLQGRLGVYRSKTGPWVLGMFGIVEASPGHEE